MDSSTFLGLMPQEWEIVNGFANWLSAIGTIAAVVIAFWLAHRQGQPRVSIQAEVSPVWFEKGSEKNREYLSVCVVNMADRPVTISHLSLRFGLFRKLWVGLPSPDQEVSSPFPIEITYGKEARWFIPLESEGFKWQEGVASFLSDSYKNWPIRFAAVYATTVTGRVFKARSDSSIAVSFSKALEKKRATL
jgi:hypothetical protein